MGLNNQLKALRAKTGFPEKKEFCLKFQHACLPVWPTDVRLVSPHNLRDKFSKTNLFFSAESWLIQSLIPFLLLLPHGFVYCELRGVENRQACSCLKTIVLRDRWRKPEHSFLPCLVVHAWEISALHAFYISFLLHFKDNCIYTAGKVSQLCLNCLENIYGSNYIVLLYETIILDSMTYIFVSKYFISIVCRYRCIWYNYI